MKLPIYLKRLKSLKNPLVVRRLHGHSMMPVLPPNTLVWGRRWYRNLEEGDIVIFAHEGKEKIKRVCGLKEDSIYLLGDHPETSTDSRHFGWISRDHVIAKVFWPPAPKSRAEISE